MGQPLPFLRPLGKLCGVPDGAQSILLAGFLGGYPVGAQAVTQAFDSGQLRKADAERMLAFCNNVGPAFLFGMAASLFPRKWMAWALWGIHIAGAIMTALIFPARDSEAVKLRGHPHVTLPGALNASLRVMAAVCGWVILFRVLISFLNRWILWLFPAYIQVGLIGLLELSNGCCELSAISDTTLRFIMCSGMLALGGCCVAMQTISVTTGLSLRYCLMGKLLQTAFSLILAFAVMTGVWLPCSAVLLTSICILRKTQKKGSIQVIAGV